MSFFVKPTEAPKARSKDAKTIAIFYAGLLTVMLVAQLFTYEGFLALLASFELPGGQVGTYLIAAFVVIAELFALPFLLRMTLSPAFRWVSMVCGWLVALAWVLLTLWQVVLYPDTDTVGFLGTVAMIVPGWWAVFVSIALGLLAAWASWGMWPGRRLRK